MTDWARGTAAAALPDGSAEDEHPLPSDVAPTSPEARRVAAEHADADGAAAHGVSPIDSWRARIAPLLPGARVLEIFRRVATGAYYDGFIHAGNLAYMSLIALFPFFITATALMSALGQTEEGIHALEVMLAAMPPDVAETLMAPVRDVLRARTGPLLWIGAAVGFWTVGSLIETIRDVLRRAYGTPYNRSFWHYRLHSIGLIIGSVLLLLLSFSAQVVILALDEAVTRLLPPDYQSLGQSTLSLALTGVGLYVAFYLQFLSLTPSRYRSRAYPKWPGALLTTVWWMGVTQALPALLASMLTYDLTYGSLAGVMIALFFFYLIGFGVVIGAELNAALAESPAEQTNRLGQGDDRARGAEATIEKE